MDQQTALDLFRYDPTTGKLYWADYLPRKYFPSDQGYKIANGRVAGKEAGTTDSGGYRQVRYQNKVHLVHRVIWLMVYGVWPSEHIDHGDHDRQNNRLNNLTDVTQAKNNAHKNNNTTGHPCITYKAKSVNRPWCVQVYAQGKYLTMKSFAALNDAINHRDDVRKLHNLPPI